MMDRISKVIWQPIIVSIWLICIAANQRESQHESIVSHNHFTDSHKQC